MTRFDPLILALEYIESNLCNEIDMQVLAKNALSSLSGLQKQFRWVFNYSIKEYISKRRLTAAAKELVETDNTILQTALKYGYHSPEVFTRAFQKMYGMKPSECRRQKNYMAVILLYFLYNVTVSALSIPMGKLSDMIGRKQVLTAEYLLFSLVYLGFGFATLSGAFVALFAVCGIFTAMTAGVERALIAEIAPKDLKGTMLGLHSTIAGIALLPASVICGSLWNSFGSAVPFVFGAVMSAIAALLLILFFRTPQKQEA